MRPHASRFDLFTFGALHSLVVRLLWEQNVGGSNPLAPTNSDTDIKTFNAQYPRLAVRYNEAFHDRFLIIDDKELYLIGASLKDLGHKCFGFTEMDAGAIRGIKKSAFGSGAMARGLV